MVRNGAPEAAFSCSLAALRFSSDVWHRLSKRA
jgi:hypothetical protein